MISGAGRGAEAFSIRFIGAPDKGRHHENAYRQKQTPPNRAESFFCLPGGTRWRGRCFGTVFTLSSVWVCGAVLWGRFSLSSGRDFTRRFLPCRRGGTLQGGFYPAAGAALWDVFSCCGLGRVSLLRFRDCRACFGSVFTLPPIWDCGHSARCGGRPAQKTTQLFLK